MTEETTETTLEVRKVTSEEMEIALHGPAMYANRIFVTATPLGARITFMEQHEQQSLTFRNAVYLPWVEFAALKELLNNTIVPIKAVEEDTE